MCRFGTDGYSSIGGEGIFIADTVAGSLIGDYRAGDGFLDIGRGASATFGSVY